MRCVSSAKASTWRPTDSRQRALNSATPVAVVPQAYAYAFKWIEENGYTAAGSPRENYIDGIWNKESEEDWLTELQIPIKKK